MFQIQTVSASRKAASALTALAALGASGVAIASYNNPTVGPPYDLADPANWQGAPPGPTEAIALGGDDYE